MVKRYLSMFVVLAFLFSGISVLAGGTPQDEMAGAPGIFEANDLDVNDVDANDLDINDIDIADAMGGYFTENDGQWDEVFSFIGASSFGHIGLGESGVYYNLVNPPIEEVESEEVTPEGVLDEPPKLNGGHVLAFSFDGASGVLPTGEEELSHKSNYFIGRDESKWATDVSSFETVRYNDLWDGIDLTYSFSEQGAKYEFTLAPGADPSNIIIRVDGHEYLRANNDALVIGVDVGKEIIDSDLLIYYNDGSGEVIDGSFKVIDGSTYTFALEDYDVSRGAVIDPYLWSTYHGGNRDDYGYGIDLDSSGNPYVCGITKSSNFPVLNAYDRYQYYYYYWDGFVSKFSTSGTLLFSTYIGGFYNDYLYDIAVDSSGNAHVTGHTYAFYTYWPVTGNAYDRTANRYDDAIYAVISSAGSSLLYSTFLGGSYYDYGRGIDVDSSGNAYICGYTRSTNFPVRNYYDRYLGRSGYYDGFVSKFDFSKYGSASLIYSTYIGGYREDYLMGIEVDSSNRAHVVGYSYGYYRSPYYPVTSNAYDRYRDNYNYDVVMTIFSSGGNSLVYSTFLGVSGTDYGRGIDVDSDGDVYITGQTTSSSFPTTSGAYDRSRAGGYDFFVTKLDPTKYGSSCMVYSTFIGGTSDESMSGVGKNIRVDDDEFVYITGYTTSSNYPTKYATDASRSGTYDAVYTKLDADFSKLMESTYLGGTSDEHGYGIAVDSDTNAYIVGMTRSSDFPTPNGRDTSFNGGTYDAFLTKFMKDVPDFTPPTFVSDNSDTIATTGDPFMANISLADNVLVGAAYVEYWYGDYGYHYNTTMTEGATAGTFSAIINIWYSGATFMHYKLHGCDLKRNFYNHPEVNITILDNDGPELRDIYTEQPTTGDPVVLNLSVWDNWDGDEVVNVFVEYVFDGNWDNSVNLTLEYNETYKVYRSSVVNVPHTLGPLEFNVSALDAQGNWATYPLEIVIVDNDFPLFLGDLTPNNPTTGDPMNFTVEVFDNIEIEFVYLLADYLDGYTLPPIFLLYNPVLDNYYRVLDYRHTMSGLKYNFSVLDTSLNTIWTSNTTMMPTDNDPPAIFSDMSPLFGYTGAGYRFNVLCTDNIDLDSFEVVYSTSLDSTEIRDDMVEMESGQFYYDIVLPIEPCSLYYKFIAKDWIGQTTETPLKTVEVKDLIPPTIEDLVFDDTAYTGDEYVITATVMDDIALSYARVYYYLGDEEPVVPMVAAAENVGSSYTFTIMVPDDLSGLHFKVVALDIESNMQAIGWITIGVMDNDLPEMVEDLSYSPDSTVDDATKPTTGDDYMFMVNVTDNIAIGSVMVYYTMPGGEEMSLILDTGTRAVWSYSGTVTVPNVAGDILYHFVIADTSMNEMVTNEVTVTIWDDEPPVPMVGLPDVVYQGEEIIMDASLSSDNVGIVEWTWAFTEVAGTPVILSGEIVNYTFEGAGLYEITLTVSDGINPGVALAFEIDVIDTEPPVALADVPEIIGSEDLLEVTAISTDNLGVISYLWTLRLPDGTKITGTGEEFTYDLIATLGILTLTLEVEDGMGNYDIAEYEIEAKDLDAPIVVTPSDVQAYEYSQLFFQDAGSYDNIGIVSYEWRVNDEVYTGTSFSRGFLVAGEYNITLTCYDSSDNFGVGWFTVSILAKGEGFDTDGDGMPDAWEDSMGLNPLVDDRNGDPDGDMIINILEMKYGLDPLNSDTDDDGLPDNYELKYGFDPKETNNADLDPDEDGDSNMVEYLQGDRRDPTVADAEEEEEDSSGTYLMYAIALALLVLIIVVIIVMFATKVKSVEEEFPEKEFPHMYKKVETAPKMGAPVMSQEPPH